VNSISLKLPDRLLKRLELESRTRVITKSSLMLRYLENSLCADAVEGKATCYDLAHNLAGSIRGLPRDVVTNRLHIKGFGRQSVLR